MAVVSRPDSPFYWLNLERPGQRVIRESTKIPVHAPTPKQHQENRRLAEAIYAARMGDLARARHQLPVDKPRITFKAYRAWYLDHIAAHKRNQIREKSMLKQLGAYFDAKDLAAIDLDAAREWRTARARQVAPNTVNRELALLKHLMASAVPKYLDKNPLAGLSDLRAPEREPRVLEPDEETRLLAVLGPEDTALVLCALDTLQRLSSVAGLQWAQDHGEYLTFLNTKTKGGKVPVSQRLRAALDALPKRGASVFASYQRGSVAARQKAVSDMFMAACRKAKILTGQKAGGLTFHGLRHTGASRMLSRGVDIETVRRIGGWANLNVLLKYLHPTDDASRRAVETIGGVYGTGTNVAPRGTRRTRAARTNPSKSGRKRQNRPHRAG